MAIFLDSGFFLVIIHRADKNHEQANEWLQKIRSGIYGQIYSSNFVMAESTTIVAFRTRGNARAIAKTRELFTGELQIATIIRATEDDEKNAWDLFLKLANTGDISITEGIVSFIDCTNIILCKAHEIEFIASFDGHFKPWLNYP